MFYMIASRSPSAQKLETNRPEIKVRRCATLVSLGTLSQCVCLFVDHEAGFDFGKRAEHWHSLFGDN
jgi:hypothetical protein